MGVEDLGRESLDNERFEVDIERVAGASLPAAPSSRRPQSWFWTSRGARVRGDDRAPANASAAPAATGRRARARATRLYIVGDLSEIRECADAPAAGPKVKSRPAAAAIADSTRARPRRPTAPVPELPEDVVGPSSFAAPLLPQPTCDDVHAIIEGRRDDPTA